MALEKIDEEMDKVTDHGVGLVAVAKAVKSLNLTLAHHTAWTEERFEAVDNRLEAIDRRFDLVDKRFDNVDRQFAVIDDRFKIVDQRFAAVQTQLDSVELRLERLDRKVDSGHSLIINELSRLAARVEKVVDFAIRDELKVREIDE